MRILFILTRGDAVGGASIHVRDMSVRLMQDGHSVHVIVGHGDLVPNLLNEANISFTHLTSMGRSVSPVNDLLALLKISRITSSFHPDLISAHTAKAGALGRLVGRLFAIPTIYTPHCWSFVDEFPNAKLYLTIERCLKHTTDQIIAVSEHERLLGTESGVCNHKNSLTIHNGMPDLPPPFAEPSKPTPNIIMVARIDDQKDHTTLLHALNKIKDLNWSATFVGDGPLKNEIETLADHLKLKQRVSFLGYSKEINAELNKAQIFVLSTRWESFPRSILEAMRQNLPIIATNTGGCAESVKDNHNGFIVSVKDQNALANKLSVLIQDPLLREQMGNASRKRYLDKFHFDIMYRNYETLYKSLILRYK